ncbi:dna cross-link repair protein snm1 [Quercus suber]|uniref:Dna cross-link repair protein snm1 n=1 Tax=Quercus suber TaxID=58331 RepID=A0AAW0JS20_QUESU
MGFQSQSQSLLSSPMLDDDDDFQIPLSLTQASIRKPLKPTNSNSTRRPSKKPKRSGKENVNVPGPTATQSRKSQLHDFESSDLIGCSSSSSLDSIRSSIVDCTNSTATDEKKGLMKISGGYLCNSIESRLLNSAVDNVVGGSENEMGEDLDLLLNLGSDSQLEEDWVRCPLCGIDISDMSNQQRQIHTNQCLDKDQTQPQLQQHVVLPGDDDDKSEPQIARQVADVSTVLVWLRSLGLERYEDVFVREEIDWDALHMGITALGPRKKIAHALSELRKESARLSETHTDIHASSEPQRHSTHGVEMHNDASEGAVDETNKVATNKLITDYFPGSASDRKKVTTSGGQSRVETRSSNSGRKRAMSKNNVANGKFKDVPSWCCIPGTSFRVDAFRHLRGDCSHWFLTHFHMDHYQGLTRSFCHGKIYCSSITASLVNMKIGIPWDRLQVLPLNQKINIAGIDVTCLDANHCPGSIMILFEPPNGKAILHTGDFRFSQDMASISVLQTCPIHTLILDTTYCNPQYDFPKQEAVIQFVVDAIQAEAFNPKTLFLIGSYTIGKERLFLDVARVLRKKVYVTAAKLHILRCLGFPEEDMRWFTINEQESHIHVVPMWTIASFKRLKHISNQYVGRFSLIVAFSPTGWTFGKGKKKSPGRRSQQGTIIRYEVPYSEHCSFTELKDFVKLVSPINVIPSVNNVGSDSANAMISLLLS